MIRPAPFLLCAKPSVFCREVHIILLWFIKLQVLDIPVLSSCDCASVVDETGYTQNGVYTAATTSNLRSICIANGYITTSALAI